MKYILLSFFTGVSATLAVVAFTQTNKQDGYIVQRESEIVKEESGPHDGGGRTKAYSFFGGLKDMPIVFRKRVLYPGASIGYHLQQWNEIYYIVQGKGEMQMNGKTFPVQAGDAVLTRPGNSHGLKPAGSDSMTVIINYVQ